MDRLARGGSAEVMGLRLRRASTPVLVAALLALTGVSWFQLHATQGDLGKAQDQLAGRLGSDGDAITFQGRTLADLQRQAAASGQTLLDLLNADLVQLQGEINELRARQGEPAARPVVIVAPTAR